MALEFPIELEFRTRIRALRTRARTNVKQQAPPKYDAGSGIGTRDKLVGGERSHHCVTPAPLVDFLFDNDKK